MPSISKELVGLFLTGPMTGTAFKQALIEASLSAELSHHPGYEPGADRPEPPGDGRLRIETPRDRDGSFEPPLVPKGSVRR